MLMAKMRRLRMTAVMDYFSIFRRNYNDWRAAVIIDPDISRFAWVPLKPKYCEAIKALLLVVYGRLAEQQFEESGRNPTIPFF